MNISGINNAMRSQAIQMGGGTRPPGMEKVGQAIADKLSMSVDDLRAARQSGTSLADLAASKGVSKDDLVATISDALNTNAGAPAIDTNKLAMMLIDGFNAADTANKSDSESQRRNDEQERFAAMSSVASSAPNQGTDHELLAWDRLAAGIAIAQ
jgi:hypothetical protein